MGTIFWGYLGPPSDMTEQAIFR